MSGEDRDGAPARGRVVEVRDFVAAAPSMDASESLRRYARLIVADERAAREGATSTLVRALSPDGETLALKVMRPSRAAAAGDALAAARERAFHEEYLNQLMVSGLRGFPEVYGCGTVEGRPAIVMEWVEGPSLHDVLEERGGAPWPGRLVARLGLAVLEILDSTTALERGFVHRDISTRNIIVRTAAADGVERQIAEGSFNVCLVDMGSAVSVSPTDGSFTMLADVWRNATPDYAPPEMLTRDVPGIDALRHSSAIDVYALCSVLYELYSGSAPYCLADHPEVSPYRLKMDAQPVPLEARSPNERDLCSIVMAGLERDPGLRPTVASLRAALEAWLAGGAGARALLVPFGGTGHEGGERNAEESEGAPAKRGVSRRALLVGAGAAALCLGAAAGVALLSRPRGGLASLSWDELADLSRRIESAGSEDAALALARDAGLLDGDGRIVSDVTKPLQVGGASVGAQLAGILHDERADGSPIGLTFLVDRVLPGDRPMSDEPYMGGWETSGMRAWLEDELVAELPAELSRNLVRARKLTNNVGAASGAEAVSGTEDLLWLPSYAELVGARADTSFSDGFQYLAEILNAEGRQYQLFSDQGLLWRGDYDPLVRTRDGEAAYWWLRTPSPDVSLSENQAYFNRTAPNGDPFHYATAATDVSGVLFGFCV